MRNKFPQKELEKVQVSQVTRFNKQILNCKHLNSRNSGASPVFLFPFPNRKIKVMFPPFQMSSRE